MQSFTAILATLATISAVSGTPINTLVARATCGSAPAGSGSQAPVSQPTGIQTAQACQALCTANGQCQSFVFGMVDNTIKCMLFPVPAAQIPKQSSANLIAFDKACTSVPAVKPTAANPTGANPASNPSPNTNQGATGNTGKTTGNTNANTQQAGKQPGQQKRDTCGAAPAGSDPNTQPLSQPAGIKTAADCLKQCKANPSCKAFTFGDLICKLFSVPAAQVPSGQGAQVFDVGCSI